MYYQLGRGGRVIWTTVVFLSWSYITWELMQCTLAFGSIHGDQFRLWLRTAGLTPGLSDFFKLFFAVTGIFIVPVITTIVFSLINKKLKGLCNEQSERLR